MRTRLVAEGILSMLVICCCGCTVQTNAPTPTPTVDGEVMQIAAQDCLDLWVNSEAPQSVIDAGMAPADPNGNVFVHPILTQDAEGVYHTHPGSAEF